MAANLDFDYLRDLAVSDDDRRLLDRIANDRQRILRGELLTAPGEYGELLLDPERAATRAAGGPAAGESPGSGPLKLTLRSDLAPASLDTFVEIFRDRTHTRFEGFGPADNETVVDLGANEGYYTLFMKRHNPGLRIVAAEPLDEAFELLRRNLAANHIGGVTACRTAVVGEGSPRTVELETYPHVTTVASLDMQGFPRPWIDPSRIRRRRVEATSLAGLLERAGIDGADLLKIDVEGSEGEIITGPSGSAGASDVGPGGPDGGEANLLRRFRRIVVECHGEATRRRVRATLEAAGFEILRAEAGRSGDIYGERR